MNRSKRYFQKYHIFEEKNGKWIEERTIKLCSAAGHLRNIRVIRYKLIMGTMDMIEKCKLLSGVPISFT
jgi:hypothetical protein